MLTGARRAVLTAVATVTVLGATAGPAGASPVECAKRNALTGVCLLTAGTAGRDDGTGAPASGTADPVSTADSGQQAPPDPCTYTVADPQPAPSHPVWAGRTATDGTVFLQVCPRPDGYGSGYRTDFVFVAAGGEPPAGQPIDPRVLAEQAIAALTLRAPELRTAPPPGSGSAVVGLPVWMWTETGEQLTGPTQQTASAGGVTVVAVAEVSQVAWDMGDGTTVICGAGTPYRPGAAGGSPDCGHVYTRASRRHAPNGAGWPITATSTWTITWSGGGLSGTETLQLSSSAELAVGEISVLVQSGGRR